MSGGTTSNSGDRNLNADTLSFWALVAEDFDTHDRDILSQGFWAVFWHRFGNWRMGLRPRLIRLPMTAIYRVMYKLTQWFCGIDLPYTVILGRRVRIEHFGGMILVADQIGDDVLIRQNTTFGIVGPPYGRPVIGDGVQLGAGAVVVGPVMVGAGAIVGANAGVICDVPPGARVGGVPARLLDGAAELAQRHG